MIKDPIKALSKKLKEETRLIKAGDKKAIKRAKEQLINAGIITKTGRLRKPYR